MAFLIGQQARPLYCTLSQAAFNTGASNGIQLICTRRLPKIVQRRYINSSQTKRSTLRSYQEKSRRDFHGMGYILLVVPMAAFGLGTWQVFRRQWKLNLIHELKYRLMADTVPFPENPKDLEELEYRRVKVRGKFDHSKELYMMPRSPVSSEKRPHGGSLINPTKGQIGANVVTAFKLSNSDLTILINRGWVSRESIQPQKRITGQIEGEVEFVGIVRHTEKRLPFGANNDVSRNHWYHRDIDKMAQVLDTAPVLIDADKNSTVPGGPVGGQTRVTLRNEHLSYIITWYSLSGLTFYMWFKSYWKRV